MYPFKEITFFVFLLCFFSSCKGGQFDFSASTIVIISNGDKLSEGAADYLFRHMNNRKKGALNIQRSDSSPDNFTGGIIYVEVVPDLAYDYEIKNEEGRLSLFGKDKAVLQWLTYMLIGRLSDAQPMEVTDLPPHYITFQTEAVRFAFDYREPHLQPNVDLINSGILFTNNVDRDWGLWGHNLHRVFANHPPSAALALINGVREDDQYCFSAPETYQAIRNFVIDQYGRGEADAKNFMIAPNDNDLVCSCAACRKAGNTKQNATPSLMVLLNRLAAEFPKHHFYTTAYRTTMTAPTVKMLENTGVFLSTIELPKNGLLDKQNKELRNFIRLTQQWKDKTAHVYLWDYISNFDDYLTPFPVMRRVQNQLTFFSEQGVKGMFLNGSGYDYTPFDDVKTYVLSVLLINPSLSVDKLVERYYQRFYPITGNILSAYILAMEENVTTRNVDIAIYTPFRQALKSYFNPNKAHTLYRALIESLPRLKGDEKVRVEKLLIALSYAQLQTSYEEAALSNGFFVQEGTDLHLSLKNEPAIALLNQYTRFKDIRRYKEEDGMLAHYLKEWEDWKKKKTPINLISAVKAIELSSGLPLEDSNILIDNRPGFLSDFNQGWLLSGESIQVECERIDLAKKKVELQLNFLINKKHRMLAPERIEIWGANQLVAQYTESNFHLTDQCASLRERIEVDPNKKIVVKIFKSNKLKNSVIACDEICLF